VLHLFIKNLIVNTKKEREITQEFVDKMHTKTPSLEHR
jgi:hypothetical protein